MSETFNIADSNYLADKVREAYANAVVYRNLIKAGRALKSLTKDERRIVLEAIAHFSQELISRIYYEDDYKFSNLEVKRIVDFTMEILFQKTLALFKADVEECYWGDPLDMVVSMCFVTEREYIISKEPLNRSFLFSKSYADRYFKNEILDLLIKKQITEEQYEKALNKTYVVYLKPELVKKGFSRSQIKDTLMFIIYWLVGLAVLYFLKNH